MAKMKEQPPQELKESAVKLITEQVHKVAEACQCRLIHMFNQLKQEPLAK